MLTIKHIHMGREFIAEADSVEYGPPSPSVGDRIGHIAQVVVSGAVGTPSSYRVICEGTVYVMNDKGRTIATYNLWMDNAVEHGITNEPASE